ncbi:unnamed protein product [Hyaloperonospora brassicae]|uniref:DUF1279 domain-containing protein n=1 Tax=Hyaloperonospora brassicae TaxID=162125 RepID=A0AAV0U4Q3_HYABA|nr:unnamed protein product [Hyaloperonospora brassicae]
MLSRLFAHATRCATSRRHLTTSPTSALFNRTTLQRFRVHRTGSLSCLTAFIASRSRTATFTRRASSSTSKRPNTLVTTSSTETKPSHLERLKDLWRKYGVVAMGTYFSLYGAVLGSIYLAIDQGWVHTATGRNSREHEQQSDFDLVSTTNKFVKWAEDVGIAQYLEVERVNAKTGSFLLAWVATKFTEPLRLALTVAATPRIARFLGRAPKLPPKTPGKLATMMQKQPTLTKEQQPPKA